MNRWGRWRVRCREVGVGRDGAAGSEAEWSTGTRLRERGAVSVLVEQGTSGVKVDELKMSEGRCRPVAAIVCKKTPNIIP
jgi:hypothetical protein